MNINKITQEFLNNAKLLNTNYISNPKLAKRFGVSVDDIIKSKTHARALIAAGESAIIFEQSTKSLREIFPEVYEQAKKVDSTKGTIESNLETTFEPKDDIELAKLHKIDLDKYKISTYWSKLKSNGKFTSSVLATLRKVDNDLSLQKEELLKEIKSYIGSNQLLNSFGYFAQVLKEPKKKGNHLLEISIPDAHFGKLAHKEETGGDYDLKIASERYRLAIQNLLKTANLDEVTDILFPIGNDMFNVDNNQSMTTAGTPQDCDTRFHKMVRVVKELLINTITGLSALAKVHVVVVPGNHDMSTMFMVGEILDAWFHNNEDVVIDNSPMLRKYFQWGKCGFQYTHGNEEKHGDLGLIFATEKPKLWADTVHRVAKLGHFHKSKTINYTSVDSYQGFQVQILPSLSGSDFWHNKKGYMSQKQAKAFLYDKEYGEIANYTYTTN